MPENAIILAGGEGARMRPLTDLRPKPLLPLLDEPAAGYMLKLLRRHGIRQATMTLRYRGEQIRQTFGDGRAYGVALDYVEEDEPLGTAGSARLAAERVTDDTLLIVSGDVLTDCDLSAMMAAHKRSGAQATVALARADDPGDYGLCSLDGQGRITRFIEKPGADAPAHGLVNAGIYLLERSVLSRIPADAPWDFGRDLFPGMAAAGTLSGWIMAGYWQDIGTPERYAQGQNDLLMGRVGLPVRGKRVGHAIMAEGASISARARITGRCYVGPGAKIGERAVVGQGTVLCRGAQISGGARVENACLWDDVRIGESAMLRNVVILPCHGNAAIQRIAPYPALVKKSIAKEG